jgi:hypothetical protein
MGHVREIPQVNQEGQKSGQIELEITYGGKESPFGGIDTSAPPAYIAPNCFALADGFLVVDNQLVAASLQPLTLPTLWLGSSAYNLLKIGTFYNSKYGYVNYALGGFTQVHIYTGGASAPSFFAYTFALTAWQYDSTNTPTIIGDDSFAVRVYNVDQQPTPATLTLPVIMGESPTYTDTGHLGLEFGVGGVSAGSATVGYSPGTTIITMVGLMVTALNGVSGTSGFTAAATADGLGITLTAVTAGAVGNTLQVADASASNINGVPPAFYFPLYNSASRWTNLENGSDGGIQSLPLLVPDPQISTTDVGGTIYFANIGPLIMKYSGPGTLTISSMYAGVRVIAKFAGSLIGLGNLPQLQNIVQNADMIFSWTATNNLDEWSPLTASGNVTGAGFTQLADIGDALRGLIVTNNTAFILREEGISYSTSLGSGVDPFSFQHVTLADEGEGAQNTALICQYDQTGAFIGNTNVFQISGSISTIGDKITSDLLVTLGSSTGPLSAFSCAILMATKIVIPVAFLVGASIYIYLPDNQTWMKSTFTAFPSTNTVLLTAVSSYVSSTAVQRQAVLSLVSAAEAVGSPVSLYALQEGTGISGSISAPSRIIFPQEEILFGRDVVIDAIYIAFNYSVATQAVVAFLINGIDFGSVPLTAGNNLNQNPIEMQIFPTSSVFTSHSPQLELAISGIVGNTYIRFSKIQMYASMEPSQRPV